MLFRRFNLSLHARHKVPKGRARKIPRTFASSTRNSKHFQQQPLNFQSNVPLNLR